MTRPLPRYIYLGFAIWHAVDTTAFQHHHQSPIIISRAALSYSHHYDRQSNPRLLPPITSALHAAAESESESEEAPTTITLSFGNVEFCLTPSQTMAASDGDGDDGNGAMSISKINTGEVVIDLNNFAGTLHVKNKMLDATPQTANTESDDDKTIAVTPPVPESISSARRFDAWNASLKQNIKSQQIINASPAAATESDDEISDDNNSGGDDDKSVQVVEEVIKEAPLSPAAAAVAHSESKAAQRFEAMLSDFRLHSDADVNLVASPRYRGLLTGTSAAINDPKVTLAFKVLYEDLGPVRMAGDLIFSKLERELFKSKESSGATNVKALGRDDACVVAARKIFDAVDADASGTISSQELLESDLLRSIGQCAECTCGKEGSCTSVTQFMDEIDKTHPKGELHFDEFLLASHHLLYEGDSSVSLFGGDDSAEELVDEMLNGREGEIGLEKADRYSKRFDDMCSEFDSWDSDDSSSKAESSNPRLALVLEGCFAGSKNPPVVDALKILYIDFRPLRMAGDLIFKLMRKLAVG